MRAATLTIGPIGPILGVGGVRMIDWSKIVKPGELYTVELPRHRERVELSIDPTGSEIGLELLGGGPGMSLAVLSAGEARSIATGLMALAAYLDAQPEMGPPPRTDADSPIGLDDDDCLVNLVAREEAEQP